MVLSLRTAVVWTGLLGWQSGYADDASKSEFDRQVEQSLGQPRDAADLSRDYGALPAEMRSAGEQIKSRDLAAAVIRQQQILATLDDLLKSSTPQDQSNPAQEPMPQPAGESTPSSADEPDNTRGPNGDGAARDSTAGPRAGGAITVNVERRRNLATSVWGHLPDREREAMLQSYRENFLPGYEDLVESYYEALAEQRLTAEPIAPQPLEAAP
jgi:hypothetical protein